MSYRELYEQLLAKYVDETGIVQGQPVMALYHLSRAGEASGYDSEVDPSFLNELKHIK